MVVKAWSFFLLPWCILCIEIKKLLWLAPPSSQNTYPTTCLILNQHCAWEQWRCSLCSMNMGQHWLLLLSIKFSEQRAKGGTACVNRCAQAHTSAPEVSSLLWGHLEGRRSIGRDPRIEGSDCYVQIHCTDKVSMSCLLIKTNFFTIKYEFLGAITNKTNQNRSLSK